MRACMSVCVCVVVVSLAQGLRSQSSSPTLAIFHLVFHLPSTSPTSPPSCDWGPGICKFKAFPHATAMVQVGLQVPTPLAVRKGLFFYEFLARLQELCLHGSQCLLSAQASWLCQVRITTSSCKTSSFFPFCVCVCASVCVCVCVRICSQVYHLLI